MNKRNKRIRSYFIIFSLIIIIGVVYAILQANLQINGTAKISENQWNVHFENIVVNQDSVPIGTGDTAAVIDPTNNCKVDFEVTFTLPGDFYEFTVDVKNEGTIDAMIGTLTKTLKVNNVETETVPEYLIYTVTYEDGTEILENHLLMKATKETYKVRVEFKTDIDAEDLPNTTTLFMSVEPTYIQADDTAVAKPVPIPDPVSFADDSWETITHVAKSGNTSVYTVGSTKTVDMGSLGIHTLRVANNSTPPECLEDGFSETACGFVLEFADIVGNAKWHNDSNDSLGGWRDSNARIYVNDTIYNSLPSVLKNAIIDTNVISSHNSRETVNNTSKDKLYLLDTREIYGDYVTPEGYYSDDSIYNLTRQLDYYKLKNTDEETNYAPASKNGEWYTRTARSNSSSSVYLVLNSGTFNGYSGIYGMSPAFRLA